MTCDGKPAAAASMVLNSLPAPSFKKSISVLATAAASRDRQTRHLCRHPLGLHALRNNAAFSPSISPEAGDGAAATAEGGDRSRADETGARPAPDDAVGAGAGLADRDCVPAHVEAGRIGKVVVSFDDENALVQEQAGASLPIASDTRTLCLVTSGTAGFGLETARWLVDNGARSLVLAARSRTLTAEAEATLGSLRSGGAAVVVVAPMSQPALASVRRSPPSSAPAGPCEESCTPPARSTTRSSRNRRPDQNPPRFHRQGARRLASARS